MLVKLAVSVFVNSPLFGFANWLQPFFQATVYKIYISASTLTDNSLPCYMYGIVLWSLLHCTT